MLKQALLVFGTDPHWTMPPNSAFSKVFGLPSRGRSLTTKSPSGKWRTRCVRKVSDLRSYLRVGAILRHPDHGTPWSSPHLIEPHAPSGAFTSQSSPRTQILEWPSVFASHYSESFRYRWNAFLYAPFSIFGTFKSRRELCRDCTEAREAVQSCVWPKIAAQGTMNALAHYRSEEAIHRTHASHS